MKQFIIQSFENPDMGAVFTVEDKDFDKAVELVNIGFVAWFGLDEEFITEHFDNDSFGWIEQCGYCEPAMFLLEQADIKYEMEECFNEEGDLFPKFYNIPVYTL